MLEVEVLYADESRRRVPLEEASTLRRNGVLFLFVSERQGETPQPSDRVGQISGHDHYALGWSPSRFCGTWFLDGWSDGADRLRLRSIENPHEPYRTMKRPSRWPGGFDVITFAGASMPDRESWERMVRIAEEIF